MSLTKTQVRTAVRQYIDDAAAKKWDDASLDVVIGMVYDDLWGDILDVAPYWNSKYEQFTGPFHAPGYIDLRLVADGGDLANRLYRIQQVIADGRQYYAKDPRDYLLMAQVNTGDVSTVVAQSEVRYTYQVMGDQLWLHPLQLTAMLGFMELRYSYRPPAFTSLGGSAAVIFVDGAEHALILAASGYALVRGDEEDPSKMLALAEQARQRMISTIRRKYAGMTVPFSTQAANEIGSI